MGYSVISNNLYKNSYWFQVSNLDLSEIRNLNNHGLSRASVM